MAVEGDASVGAGVKSPVLVYHAASQRAAGPPNSLHGLRACLAAGAGFIEVDVTPLADGEFALLHDRFLEQGTDGKGTVNSATAEQVRGLRLLWQGAATDEAVATLREAVALAGEIPALQELHLDLKTHTPIADASLAALAQQVIPLGTRVRVSSTDDRAIRRLALLAPDLPLGYDPRRYLDMDPGASRPRSRYLARAGVYGYLDDHPLAADRWGTPAQYLAARAEALWALAPVPMWYVRATLLARMLADGFDWIADLHARGAQVTAWTLNPGQPHHIMLAAQLVARGVDRIITDDADGLAAILRKLA